MEENINLCKGFKKKCYRINLSKLLIEPIGQSRDRKNYYIIVDSNLWSILVQRLYHILISMLLFFYLLQTAWIAIKHYAEYKPLQFLAFAFVYRFFEKLKSFEPAVSPTYTVSCQACLYRLKQQILNYLFYLMCHHLNRNFLRCPSI